MLKKYAMGYDLNSFHVILCLSAFLVVAGVIPFARRLAVYTGFVDKPDDRKRHDEPVPPVGGLIIFPIAMTGIVMSGIPIVETWPFLLALALLLIAGGLDDYMHVDAWPKFLVHFIAAYLVVVPGGAIVHHLGDIFGFGKMGLDFMAVPFSIIAVVLLINAVNLMDGLDGLAGGLSFVMLGWLFVLALAGERGIIVAQILPLLGALAGFLLYNMRSPIRKKASIFLGDAGSMALGLSLAWFAIPLVREPEPVTAPITIAWILALPIMDACAQFYRRAREGRHPFSPDRGHFHHHFVDAGISAGRSVVIILCIGIIAGSIGYAGDWWSLPQPLLAALWGAILVAHIFISYKPENYKNFLKHNS